jgi:hypothetical protein
MGIIGQLPADATYMRESQRGSKSDIDVSDDVRPLGIQTSITANHKIAQR